jgi:hypothetical protein
MVPGATIRRVGGSGLGLFPQRTQKSQRITVVLGNQSGTTASVSPKAVGWNPGLVRSSVGG